MNIKVRSTGKLLKAKVNIGKNNALVEIADKFVKKGMKTLILDGDLGMSNVDIVLGIEARYTIRDLLDGHKGIEQIVVDGPLGLKLIPSGSGISNLLNLSFVEEQIFRESFDFLKKDMKDEANKDNGYFKIAVKGSRSVFKFFKEVKRADQA